MKDLLNAKTTTRFTRFVSLIFYLGKASVFNRIKKAVFIGLSFVLIMVAKPAEALAEYIEKTSYYKTTANLRLRMAPSLNAYVIKTVRNGSTVRVYDRRDGEWFAVSANGSRGYMNFEFLTPASASEAEQSTLDMPSDPHINAHGVEHIDWSEARNNIIRTGVPLHITDVRTGITLWVESFSNGNHADVVPRTREDTEALRSAFGGRWSWEPRAVWVTVDGRTFAASISGMPHGGFNSIDNGIVGHVCLHFPGSRTHNGNRSHERDHQNRVSDAFNASR